MNNHTVCAPQLGEGLKEIKVVQFLKNIGEYIEKDVPIIVVETEKATMEIEAPVSGIVSDIFVSLNERVAVGSSILNIHSNISTTHQYKSLKSITDGAVNQFSAPSKELETYKLSERQLMLIKNMHPSENQAIPALITIAIPSEPIQTYKRTHRNLGLDVPSLTECISLCTIAAMHMHEKFRSTLLDDSVTLKVHSTPSIGIAVGLPEDELAIMRISSHEFSDSISFRTLYKKRLKETKNGIDHAGPHTVSISDMTSYCINYAVPVIVRPAVATLCIGKETNNYILSLSFDHRIINGIGAAKFLKQIYKNICSLRIS